MVQHKEGEQGVVPVLVKHPKTNAEYLEDKKGSDGMFPEKFGEGRDGDIEGICAIVLFKLCEFSL